MTDLALFAGVSSIMVAFIFESRRRGLIFTYTPESNLFKEFVTFFKHYHGYLSSFGMVLTFWYHTMECTFAHMTGFFHIFLLLWQSSLIYQQAHRNRYWTATIEMWIILHAAIVSYFQDYPFIHQMFVASFALLFIMGPVWGLPVVKRYIEGEDERAGERRKFRFFAMLTGLMLLYVFGVAIPVYRNQPFYYVFGVTGLPLLYYLFIGYYFIFFKYFRNVVTHFEGFGGIFKQGAGGWWTLVIGSCVITMAVILGASEFVYRLFVPYHFQHYHKH